jgi:hypothetical protein
VKTYKVTYKTYFNERLNPVKFHGMDTHPLYIQVTFDRKSIFFKSYYFDLLQQPGHNIHYVNKPLDKIKAKEEQLIEFIISKNEEGFTLDQFSEDYKFYSKDILGMMEAPFKDYLFHFFSDEGIPSLAGWILDSSSSSQVKSLLREFKRFLKPALYDKLLENAVYYAPPLQPLEAFTRHLYPEGLFCLPVFEWQQSEVQTALGEFLDKHYPLYEATTLKKDIEKLISSSRQSNQIKKS